MGRKKKEAEPIFKPLDTPTQIAPSIIVAASPYPPGVVYMSPPPPPIKTHPPLANYGADEKPRQCIHCASKNSRVNRTRTTGRITIRARVCQSCGKNFVTREIAP